MADNSTETKSPLQTVDTYSGKLYWLNTPSGKTLNLKSLKETLQERTFQEDISEEFDRDDVVVPGIFEKDGQMTRTTTTEDVTLVEYENRDIVVGEIVLDNANKITYRDQQILILDTTKAEFLVFEESGFYYLCVLARRELAKTVIEILRSEFSGFGSIINQTRIGANAISNIRTSLNATLVDTIITDYDQNEITQTRIQGEGYEDTAVYNSVDSGGRVKSHMFQTEKLVPDETKTILVGRDGLVRIYSNATLQTYTSLLEKYIIPEVDRDVESSPSVGAWEAASHTTGSSIFEDR